MQTKITRFGKLFLLLQDFQFPQKKKAVRGNGDLHDLTEFYQNPRKFPQQSGVQIGLRFVPE